MAGSKSDIDPELLGRVASMTPGQQRWLRTILASVFSMDDAAREAPVEQLPERPRRRAARRELAAEREREGAAKGETRSESLEKVLRGEGVSEEEYPELADELQGIADIAALLRESGRERRRFGEELLRLLESEPSDEDEEERDEREDELR